MLYAVRLYSGDSHKLTLLTFCVKGVFTYLVDNLGVKDVQFEELVALDADYLRQQRCVAVQPAFGAFCLLNLD